MSTLYITTGKKSKSETIISVRKVVWIITLLLPFSYMVWYDISIALHYDINLLHYDVHNLLFDVNDMDIDNDVNNNDVYNHIMPYIISDN